MSNTGLFVWTSAISGAAANAAILYFPGVGGPVRQNINDGTIRLNTDASGNAVAVSGSSIFVTPTSITLTNSTNETLAYLTETTSSSTINRSSRTRSQATQTLTVGNSASIKLSTNATRLNTAIYVWNSKDPSSSQADGALLLDNNGNQVTNSVGSVVTFSQSNSTTWTVNGSFPKSGFPWWGWLLIIGGVLLFIILIGVIVGVGRKKTTDTQQGQQVGRLPTGEPVNIYKGE
jgi:hypothetical protein